MKKLAIAFAMVLGLNMIGSTIISAPKGYAQETPAPEPEKPEKPDSGYIA